MTTHEIIVTVLGFVLVVGSLVAHGRYKTDGLLCWLAFIFGIWLIVYHRLPYT